MPIFALVIIFATPATTLDLSSLGIQPDAGATYHAVYRTATALISDWYYSAHLMYPHSESFGLPMLHNRGGASPWTSSILEFEPPLEVSIVPEPVGWPLAIVGLAALAAIGRLKRGGRSSVRSRWPRR